MSVQPGVPSDAAEFADEYDDLDKQTIESNFTIGGATGESAGPAYYPEAHTFKPLGGLARNQRAELVGIYYNRDLRDYAGTDFNNPVEVTWWYELHQNGQFVANTAKDIDQTLSDKNGIQTVGTNFRTENNPGTLLKDHVSRSMAFQNTTDGAGGPGGGNTASGSPMTYNFRAMIGEGPIFYPDDDLNESFEVMLRKATNNSAIQIGFDRDLVLYWDVYEVEELDERRR